MTSLRDHVAGLYETRQRVWREAQAFLDECQTRHPDKPLSAEERAQWVRYNERLDELDNERQELLDRDLRESETAAVRQANPAAFGEGRPALGRYEQEDAEYESLRSFLNGTGPRQLRIPVGNAMRRAELLRSGRTEAEVRSLMWDTGNVASAVPTLMARDLYEVLEADVAMLRLPTTKLSTPSGANLDVPKLTTHSIGTQVIAQGTAIGGTDPAFGKMTLGAYKYGELMQVASEVIEDAGIDILSMVAKESVRAVGRVVDADLVAGTGTGEPLGIFPAITGAGTIATGGSLVTPTYEKLIDLAYSVNGSYRDSGGAAWLFHDSTAGTLRKLRDGGGGTVGAPIWQSNTTGGISVARQPDLLLGWPALTDPNVASMASNAKIIAFGDWSAYYIRHVGDIVFERDDSFAFDKDMVTFRAKWRVDGDLADTAAINVMKQSV